MDKTPKILIVVDEPGMMVDMFLELEGRGFAVEPVKPSDCADRVSHHAVDVAIFDLHKFDTTAMAIVSRLHGREIPVITLGNSPPEGPDRGVGALLSLPKPVDYNRLADFLSDLIKRPRTHWSPAGTAIHGAGYHDRESSVG
ncbi:response regulator [Hoeflea olei]|uniref:Response regulatory domain-containing protein n=1 Tax=Hoeflea olei TaxID=1480615 RepID=A0A1C1YU79_9HYPH|nr:response regulator [Hoeflea olei]OCW56977.1 hypothetical protein AWJ14_07430 [Hoeflea olei]